MTVCRDDRLSIKSTKLSDRSLPFQLASVQPWQADAVDAARLAAGDSAVSSNAVGHIVGMKRPTDLLSQCLQIQLAET